MTVSVTGNKISYNGDGSTTDFTFPYPTYEDADLVVYVVNSSGVPTQLTLGVGYTVTGSGGASCTVSLTSGSLCATGEKLVITRILDLLQSTDYVDGEIFTASSMETRLDKTVLVIQQLQEQADRSIRFHSSDSSSSELSDAGTRASTTLGFDSSGDLTYLSSPISYSGQLVQTAAVLRAVATGALADKAPAIVQFRSVKGDDGGGTFYWSSADLSSEVAADTLSGLYIAPNSDLTGASGAWVRSRPDDYFYGGWFGISSGMSGATAAIQAFLSTVGNRLQSLFTRIPTYPLASVVIPRGAYTITSTLELPSLCDYNLEHSVLTFSPSVAGDNLFEILDSWSLATYPTGFNVRINRVHCVGDYDKLTDTGNSYGCFYLPITAYVLINDFSISGFELGAQFGQDTLPQTTVGNYYNSMRNGEITSCRMPLISNTSAAYFQNVVFRTGSGIYANPASAFITIAGTGNAFSNCDVEMGSTSGYDTVFALSRGITVHGGYQESATGSYMVAIDTEEYATAPSNININFSTLVANCFLFQNDATSAEKAQRTLYINSIPRMYTGTANYEYIKYNRTTGQEVSLVNYSGPTRENLFSRCYPYFTATLAGGYISVTGNIPRERFGYLHFITKGEATNRRIDNSWGITAHSSSSISLVTKFEDLDIWHYCAEMNDYTLNSLILKIYNDTGIGLLNVYFSDSPTLFSLENKISVFSDSDPDMGTWSVGDIVNSLAPAPSGTIGRVCTTAGTGGTLAGVTTTSTNGSATITVNDSSDLAIGDYCKLAAHAQVRRIKTITGTTVVMDGAFYYTGASTLDYSAPVFKTFGSIAA